MNSSLSVYEARKGDLVLIGEMLEDGCLYGLHEGRSYRIRIDQSDAQLFVDDAPLSKDPTGLYWCWEPGFFAGEVVAELELPGQRDPWRFRLEVSPHQNKTGKAQYLEYIEQIADYDIDLLMGAEPGRTGLGGHSCDLQLWIRYVRLRSFITRYLAALRTVAERPVVRLSHRREQVPIQLARRVDNQSIRRLAANPQLLSAIARQQGNAGAVVLDDNRLDVPFIEPTLDNPANRLMAGQLSDVLRLTVWLTERLTSLRLSPSDTQTDLAARLPRRAAFLSATHKRLLKLSRSQPFSGARQTWGDVAGLNAVSGHPHYDLAYRLGTRILRNGLSEQTVDEQHYLAPTWQVYENWCFVVLAQALEGQLPEFKWRLRKGASYADRLLEGACGAARIRLYFQLTCPSLGNTNSHGYCSISRERRPDLVLEYKYNDEIRYLCLDSKYTASRAGILDAMASAHVYHDSIRGNGQAPVISALLVPANQGAELLEQQDYFDNHGVGVYRLFERSQANRLVGGLIEKLELRLATAVVSAVVTS
ncbi:hypothetical protein A8C75_21965 [Marinobacterium aestuarii]|uniref:DUF2357 domain-containing protein n=1 Tax=Marinobacterium aestuarii TaxID=1821621 RepID=A0A1A9F581_9GAMM|nr:nuclease domain-containing protein [Marinobacterium aestuarii]ANG64883.1 hypothetical protein A8C75_21965 [Marinobacterium aestuarii]